MIAPETIRTVRRAAVAAGVPVPLAIAVCEVESAGDHLAVRFEPGWRYFYQVEAHARSAHITVETERTLQAMSWGLMQVMGSVARELGHQGSLLALCDAFTGAKYGCLKLASFLRKYSKMEDAIAAYNAGSPRRAADGTYVNQAYVDKVLRNFRASVPPKD